jgi:hypothetical protein
VGELIQPSTSVPFDSYRFLGFISRKVMKAWAARGLRSKPAEIPWTPLTKPLAESRVAPLTTAAVALSLRHLSSRRTESVTEGPPDPLSATPTLPARVRGQANTERKTRTTAYPPMGGEVARLFKPGRTRAPPRDPMVRRPPSRFRRAFDRSPRRPVSGQASFVLDDSGREEISSVAVPPGP